MQRRMKKLNELMKKIERYGGHGEKAKQILKGSHKIIKLPYKN